MRDISLPTNHDSNRYMRIIGRVIAVIGVVAVAALTHLLWTLAAQITPL